MIKKILLSIFLLQSTVFAAEHIIQNDILELTFQDNNASFSVTDKRNNYTWQQDLINIKGVSDVTTSGALLSFTMNDAVTGNWKYSGLDTVEVTLELVQNRVHVTIDDSDDELMNYTMWYPHQFRTPNSSFYAVMPMNEGALIPVDSFELFKQRVQTFVGWDCSLPMFGYTDMDKGYMCLIETAYDTEIYTEEINGRSQSSLRFFLVKDKLGGQKRLIYYFYDQGSDYNNMADDVREWMEQNNFVETLKEKEAKNPNLKKANKASLFYPYWLSDKPYEEWVDFFKDKGVKELILAEDVSSGQYLTQDNVTAKYIRDNGYLLSWYSIYQDTWDPAEYPTRSQRGWDSAVIRYKNQDLHVGFREGYRNCRKAIYDTDIKTDDRLLRGVVEKRRQEGILDYILIDTTATTGLTECWHPEHGINREQDARYRQNILQYHKDNGFLVGTEGGAWWCVPNADVFEGIWTLTKWFTRGTYDPRQVDFRYRIPLFSLVFSDCVYTTARWDDALDEYGFDNNSIDWDRKILFSTLYGTMHIVRSTTEQLALNQDKIADSFKIYEEVREAIGTSKMVSHKFLNDSKSRQETIWSNGVRIVVDFDEYTYGIGAA